MAGLRLVVFDATDRGGPWRSARTSPGARDGRSRERLGLAPVWWLGARVHSMLQNADAWLGATTWNEAIRWATDVASREGRPIASLQAWGHGGWGDMRIGASHLDRRALAPGSDLAPRLDALREALAGPESLVWLRCCSAFGHHGRDFGRGLADRLGCHVAGHTFVIGFFQSGTHVVAPGVAPDWDAREGIRWDGDVATGPLGSSPFAPSTVTCLHADPPA